MRVSVKNVRKYHPCNSMNFCVGNEYNVSHTLSGAFSKIRSIYDEIMEEGDMEFRPIGLTESGIYYTHICSFITGEVLFFVKVYPDRSIEILSGVQSLMDSGF